MINRILHITNFFNVKDSSYVQDIFAISLYVKKAYIMTLKKRQKKSWHNTYANILLGVSGPDSAPYRYPATGSSTFLTQP